MRDFLWNWWPWTLRRRVRDLTERNVLLEDRATALVTECARLRREATQATERLVEARARRA